MRILPPLLLLMLAPTLPAQIPGDFETQVAKGFSDVASVEASITPKAAKPGEVVRLKLTITVQPECYTYPTTPDTTQSSKNTIRTPAGFCPLLDIAKPVDPAGLKSKPGLKAGEIEKYYVGNVTWEWQAVVSPKAYPGKVKLTFDSSSLMACNSSNCFNASASEVPSVEFEVLPGPAAAIPSDLKVLVEAALNPKPVAAAAKVEEKNETHTGLIRKDAKSTDDHIRDLAAVSASLVKGDSLGATAVGNSLLGLLTAAVFWGLVSLVTPCVFPMIPITVSLFLKQSHQSPAGAMKYALVYCLTIIVVLGLGAAFLLSTFQALAVSPLMNVLLGILLFVFALSLLGMFDIQLPGFLLRFTEKRRASGGLIGTVFGACAFSIVSFTCVAPFLGGFAGLTASGNYSTFELILAAMVFAAAFASPFFVLALFPSWMKKLPRSGSWLDTVKAVMGFLELAAAFKFLRAAEIRRPPVEYFTFDLVLGAWVVISLACGMYLLGLFRLPHDEEKPHLSVPRLIFALMFLGVGVYLLPGLFKTADGKPLRSNGLAFAWVESFLLPEPNEDLPWSFDLKDAIEEARKEKKFVFVDFTGVNCTNCRFNEHSVFPGVSESLRKYKLVQVYTDDMPLEAYKSPPSAQVRKGEADANAEFQNQNFGTKQLPLYVILQPLANGNVRIADVYSEGKINDKDAFAAFVSKPLAK